MKGNALAKDSSHNYLHKKSKCISTAERIKETEITQEILESLENTRIEGEVLSTTAEYIKGLHKFNSRCLVEK